MSWLCGNRFEWRTSLSETFPRKRGARPAVLPESGRSFKFLATVSIRPERDVQAVYGLAARQVHMLALCTTKQSIWRKYLRDPQAVPNNGEISR